MVAKSLFLMENGEGSLFPQKRPLLQVQKLKLWLYIGLQIFGVACSIAISQAIAGIGEIS